ncbi:uncharacterized protein [Misgurnus anguillicaudatus]|uniref:uncharacterized protein n=1 Tax=Misgurnus anguillicaudatus TaxID=75329 RepID=UPI0024352AC2|nr:uncharacterized protein LOC129447805 isoform X1 [Misgurnus anguillicaudatus]
MSQLYLSSVKDLKCMEDITRLVQEGILSLCNTCTALFDAHVDPATDLCSNFKQIRRHIKYADRCLKESEGKLKVKLKSLEKCMERLIAEKQHVQQEKKEKSLAIEELRIMKSSTKESLSNSKAELKQAEKNKEAAEYEQEKMKKLMTTGMWITVAGVVITPVPIIGWLTGPQMMCDGVNTMMEALHAIDDAIKEQEECQSQIKKHSQKIQVYNRRISETQDEIEETIEMLSNIQGYIKWLQQRLAAIAEIQKKFRTAVHFMGILSGRVNVLESHTRSCIYWEPVIKIMQDVGNAVTAIANNELLYNQDVSRLINRLSKKMKKLEALCNTPDNSEYVCYY